MKLRFVGSLVSVALLALAGAASADTVKWEDDFDSFQLGKGWEDPTSYLNTFFEAGLPPVYTVGVPDFHEATGGWLEMLNREVYARRALGSTKVFELATGKVVVDFKTPSAKPVYSPGLSPTPTYVCNGDNVFELFLVTDSGTRKDQYVRMRLHTLMSSNLLTLRHATEPLNQSTGPSLQWSWDTKYRFVVELTQTQIVFKWVDPAKSPPNDVIWWTWRGRGNAGGQFTLNPFRVVLATASLWHACVSQSYVDRVLVEGEGTVKDDPLLPPPAPEPDDIDPVTGSTEGGDKVTVMGAFFSDVVKVTLGTKDLSSFTLVSDTELTFTTEAHAAGTVDLVLTDSTGQTGTLSQSFTFVEPPPPPEPEPIRGYLVIEKVAVRDRASNPAKNRLVAKGLFDRGPTAPDLDGAASLTIGSTVHQIYMDSDSNGNHRNDDGDTFEFVVSSAAPGASRCTFRLTAKGQNVSLLNLSENSLRFVGGGLDLTGQVPLEGGRYPWPGAPAPTEGPELSVEKGQVKTTSKNGDVLKLELGYDVATVPIPPPAPGTIPLPPPITIGIGDHVETIQPEDFVFRKGAWRYRGSPGGLTSVAIDPSAGSIKVKGRGLVAVIPLPPPDPSAKPLATDSRPVTITLTVGEVSRSVEVCFYKKKRKLKY